MNTIRYEGKMTDCFPSWVWEVATDYLQNPFDYTKIIDYLKNKHGKKRPKIIWTTIEEITTAPAISKPKLQLFQLDTGKNSNNGKTYYTKLQTIFTIENTNYHIDQEVLIYVSELLSQVLERKVYLYEDDNLVVEVE